MRKEGKLCVLKIVTKVGIYYGEQYGKYFKAQLKVSEEELEKYQESWACGKVFLVFPFFKCYGAEIEYVIWCIKYVTENLHRIFKCYDNKTNVHSYTDDILDMAYYS